MATNTSALKAFAQQTRIKLISLIKTKLQLVLNTDTSELRGYEVEITKLRSKISQQGEDSVIEEVAYTWFNRMMALRFMDANGYNSPMIVTPAAGQTRPEILQDAMSGNIDDELSLSDEDKLLPEVKLYRRLLIAVCNQKNHAMPFLFERIADYSELLLPDDLLSEQSFVTDIRNGMSDDDCQNVELMGWLYQFYIIDRKADAEIKKTKKGGLKSDEQAAATQLFTPHWVVRYMVENTLGKIWMTLHPESHLIDEMPYYIKSPEGQVDPIPEDISKASDIRFIDPCMGSGHVLVYAFDLFTKMYEEEGEMTKDIPNLILTNNIYGIDIDPRCYQLASFALTMKARAYYNRYLRRTVSPNVIALQNIGYDTIESTGNWPKDSLMWQFENVDTIGSLLKVTPAECAAIKVGNGLFGANQKRLKKQAEYLSGTYHCVVTNPPYLGKGFGDDLKNFINTNYPNSKSDLYAAFIERLSDIVCRNGFSGLVTMESWMFLSSFEKLRKYLIDNKTILSLSHFDWHIMRIAFGTVAFVLQNRKCDNDKGVYSYLSRKDVDLNIELPHIFPKKDNGRYSVTSQKNFEKIPGCPIAYWVSPNIQEIFTSNLALSAVASPCVGLQTADNARFLRLWFEITQSRIGFGFTNAALAARSQKKWFPYNKGGGFRKWYGNQDTVVNWENDGYEIKNFMDSKGKQRSVVRNPDYYFRNSVSWGLIASTSTSFRIYPCGFIYDVGGMSLFTNKDVSELALMGSLNTKLFLKLVKVINPTINMQCGDVARTPYLEIANSITKQRIEALTEENISISKQDWDAHETSWDFQTSPLFDAMLGDIGISKSQFYHSRMIAEANKGVLLAEVCKTYSEQCQTLFMQLHTNEEELNRQFLEIYGLQDELTPDVPLNEITILQKGEISIENDQIVWHNDIIIKQFISYLVGCYMGRYSVDKPGLIIASQGQTLDSIAPEVQKILKIDDDGIIPFIQEPDFFADDMTERIQIAIRKLFRDANYYENLKFIDDTLGCDLREYLFKTFYTDHVQMYQKRPIYWLFSSKMGDKKKKGYFKALVYMHRIEGDTLSKLHADYVHPYLEKVEMQLKEAEYQATRDDLSTAQRNKALKLVDELKDKVREVRAFEQQLVEMASHRMIIDLDDGVKTNYPKYYPLVEPIKGLESSED
ncbi:MAG: BREX-1 system adenine-specific DNA-methyltransferase PglX [Bacteroides sp.]